MRIDLSERNVFDGLLWREARFIREFFATNGDVAAATARAGYEHPPLGRRNVREAMRHVFREFAATKGVEASAVLGELATIAFAPIEDSYVTVKEKLAALTWIGKHLGMFDTNVNVNVRGRLEVVPCLEKLSDVELQQLESLLKKASPVGSDGAELPKAALPISSQVESSSATRGANGKGA